MYDVVFYENALEQSIKLGWKGVIEIKGKKAVLKTPGEEKEFRMQMLQGNRKNAEHKKNVYLRDFERLEKRDHTHYPRSGIDQIIAKLMKKNNNAYCFPTQELLKQNLSVGRRTAFNMKLANKYGFPIIIASFATKKSEQRNPEILRALAENLGLREDIAKKSFIENI